MPKFLIIQTAFTGDVVLATALIEKLHQHYPDAQIDFLLRKGNEGLLAGHPFITNLLVWDKQKNKNRNLLAMALRVRRQAYTHVVNVHRFATSGFISLLSGAGWRAGFDKNPFSFAYSHTVKHILSPVGSEVIIHETDRNQQLIAPVTDDVCAMPRLYPQAAAYDRVAQYRAVPYVCVAPSSVWYTKQFPAAQWAAMIDVLPAKYTVYLLGGPGDSALAERIRAACKRGDVVSMCGKLDYLQSAALMQGAVMNYANDSAPLHFASAMNAPVTAVFCSTVPEFGFGPLRDGAKVVQVRDPLYCRPCGLHGHKTCPEGHFRCAKEITNEQLLWWTSKTI